MRLFNSKIIWKRLLDILLCLSLKKQSFYHENFKNHWKIYILWRFCYAWFACSINTPINSPIMFFTCRCRTCKKNFSFNFEHDGLCLQVLHQRINNYCGTLYRNDTVTWGKNYPRETGFLIYKSEISLVKNITPSQDGIIFTCNQKSSVIW